MEKAMKTPALAAALALAFGLAACGETMDGSDTADMTSDAVSADTGTDDASDYQPNEDGPLQNDVVPDDREPVDEATMENKDGVVDGEM